MGLGQLHSSHAAESGFWETGGAIARRWAEDCARVWKWGFGWRRGRAQVWVGESLGLRHARRTGSLA